MDRVNIEKSIQEAIEFFWNTRSSQGQTNTDEGVGYVGKRAQVTGGKQLDGVVEVLRKILIDAGVDERYIFDRADLELPGFYRANKKWDLVVVKEKQLILAIELKSQVGPSFANNFNNRTEEAMGSALDIWTAYREGAFGLTAQPWLGYLMVLEDCDKSNRPVKNRQPHFAVLPEFEQTSYKKRYEIFCSKLMLERQYSHTCFITTKRGDEVTYEYPREELSFLRFAEAMVAHVKAAGVGIK